MVPHSQPPPGGPNNQAPPNQQPQQGEQPTQGPQGGAATPQQQAPQQQPLEKIKEHKQKQAQAAQAQAEAPSRRWGHATDNAQTQQTGERQQGGSKPKPQQQQSSEDHQQGGGTQQHAPADQEQDDPQQTPELEEVCDPQGGQDQQEDQCRGGASQSNYHEGQGDQRRGNKATKSEIRAEFKKRGLHKPDQYTWNQVAHWVDMVPFDAAEGEGSQQSPTQQGDTTPTPARGDKEAIYATNVHNKKGAQQPTWGTRPQQNIANATLPDNKGTTAGSRPRRPPHNATQAERSKKEDMAAIRPIQRQENAMEPNPDQLQQEGEWLGGRGRTCRASTTGTASSTTSRTVGGVPPH